MNFFRYILCILLLGAVISVSVAAESLNDGLVAYWKLDKTDTPNIVLDSSSNNINGEIHGATWVEGKFGDALDFNGVDNWVLFPNSDEFNSIYSTNQFSISTWINQRTHPINDWTKHQFIFMKGEWDRDPGYINLMYFAQGDKPQFSVGAKFNSNDPPYGIGLGADATSIPINKWAHLAGTYDGSCFRIYVNGDLAATGDAIEEHLQPNTGPMMIGHFVNPNWPYPFDGQIDEVRIYNKVLSEGEIRDLYSGVSSAIQSEPIPEPHPNPNPPSNPSPPSDILYRSLPFFPPNYNELCLGGECTSIGPIHFTDNSKVNKQWSDGIKLITYVPVFGDALSMGLDGYKAVSDVQQRKYSEVIIDLDYLAIDAVGLIPGPGWLLSAASKALKITSFFVDISTFIGDFS